MDLGRGSLLAQVWTDTAWLSPPERRALADFVALLKTNSGCFSNTRFILGDHSILSGGENADGDVYTVTAQPGAAPITAVMLETLLDDSLPEHGPGRAVNGNFALVDFHLLVEPAARPGERTEIKFSAARADFSQSSHGGWPVGAAIDSNLVTGWSIFPQTGAAHAAVFDLAQPLSHPDGATLTFNLTQGERGHSLGRLRLSVTSDPSPALPPAYSPVQVVAQGRLPATRSGGMLLLVGSPAQATPRAAFAGQPVQLDSVWSDHANWPCPWKAWRAEVRAQPAGTRIQPHLRARGFCGPAQNHNFLPPQVKARRPPEFTIPAADLGRRMKAVDSACGLTRLSPSATLRFRMSGTQA